MGGWIAAAVIFLVLLWIQGYALGRSHAYEHAKRIMQGEADQ